MSTNDVPGANPGNADILAAGCWAEHEDGSLVFVKGTEKGQVVYELYDLSQAPVVSYTDAMREGDFKVSFSYPPTGSSTEKWTWHDKTPFPWDRVMAQTSRPRPSYASVHDQMSAAARVAESLNLRGRRVAEDAIRHQTEEPARRGYAILDKIGRAMEELLK